MNLIFQKFKTYMYFFKNNIKRELIWQHSALNFIQLQHFSMDFFKTKDVNVIRIRCLFETKQNLKDI